MSLPFPTFLPGFRLIDGSALNSMAAAIQNALPWPGTFYYVDPKNGSDQNSGVASGGAWQSLPHALTAVPAGKNNVIVLMTDGTTASTARLTATLTWSSNATHLVGISAPTSNSQRARISHLTTATTNINPLINVTAADCMFMNFSVFQGIGQASTDEQMFDITAGQRNFFYNVDFQGMGATNGAARSGSYILAFKGAAAENTFERCNFGLETIARSAGNATVVLAAASLAERNDFYDCNFFMYPTTVQTQVHLLVNAGTLNGGHMLFKRCTFGAFGASNVGGALQPSVTATLTTPNGEVYFDMSSTRCAKWATGAPGYSSAGVGNAYGGGMVVNS